MSSALPAMPSVPPMAGVADELSKLAALRDAGVLSEDEFAAQKRRLLGN
ncbi:SHOCT domain-containing protein [Arthrobacter sp. 2MCAF15]